MEFNGPLGLGCFWDEIAYKHFYIGNYVVRILDLDQDVGWVLY